MQEIDMLRKNIDNIDKEIIRLLEQRYTISDKIGNIKQTISKEIIDTKREEIILDKINKLVNTKNQKDIQSIYMYIMEISKNRQQK